jgi:NADH-quinone oxidoreductase subunit E
MPISDVTRDEARLLVQRYPVARSALLPLLYLVQSEQGYVSEEGIAFCAEMLALTKAEVGAVATFYTMYKREPFGDYLLSVCTNPTCEIAGAGEIYSSYVERCGGHVDREGAGVMVEHAECLGICDAAPVVQINYEMYGPVTHDEAMELLDKAKAGDPPPSNRSGEVPPTIHQVHRELSGIEDGIDEQLIEAARLQATAPVPPSYRSAETDIPVSHPGGDPAGHGGHAFRADAGLGADPRPTRPEEQPPTGDTPVVDELAEAGRGTDQLLAEQVTGDAAAPETPAKPEQPGTAGGDAPAEASGAGASGSEQRPDDSIAGDPSDAPEDGDAAGSGASGAPEERADGDDGRA